MNTRLAAVAVLCCLSAAPAADPLEAGFAQPPPEAKLRAYWWWLNGNVDREVISRDLGEMADKGFGGALICDAGGAEQDGNAQVPHGPTFMTPEWRALYRHALQEASRHGLEMSLNIQSGWNLGGPVVKAEDAPKQLTWSIAEVTGGAPVSTRLNEPKSRPAFYRDIAVLAWPLTTRPADAPPRKPIETLEAKALIKPVGWSAPSTEPLLHDLPDTPGEEDFHATQVVDITKHMGPDGQLTWEAPPGLWRVLRIGCTLNAQCRVSTCSEGWAGYALDPFDAGAFTRYWDAVVEPLIADAGPLAGTTLKYLHTDSWEVEVANWTPTLREEFRKRRGYDLLAWLPAIAGQIVDSRSATNRFLHDLRLTIGELAMDNHYRIFSQRAHAHGLLLHPESGGPHAVPIDSLTCLGLNDAPMSEFWARSWRHRVADQDRFFVKQPASAAHTYGRKLVLAEGFTTIGPHWQETPWDNLKPSFDRAACEGLNRLVWHAFTCSPAEMGLPGQEYFAGTHFNPNSSWWPKSAAFLAYLNRCQFMLQQGLFVADAVYYYGDHVPNFAQLRASDPAGVGPGYDYDVATQEVLLTRMSARDGRIVLPDGMSYRVLVLPKQEAISLPVLRKLKELVTAGATVIGPRPKTSTGLAGWPESDRQVTHIASELWGPDSEEDSGTHHFGQGRVIWGRSAREVLSADKVAPDFDYTVEAIAQPQGSGPAAPEQLLDFIHRRDGRTEIYFICNRFSRAVAAEVVLRVAGLAPELWDPLTGEHRPLPEHDQSDGLTSIPLELAPYGSCFIVFRTTATEAPGPGLNFPEFKTLSELAGPWQVHFDTKLGGPATAEFPELASWTKRPEEGIRHYSGVANYVKRFDLPDGVPAATRLWLDLGDVREVAEVRLNGRALGQLWARPLRVEITGAIQAKDNLLEIEVASLWVNRVIGDQSLPADQRHTRTNIRKLTAQSPLSPSGLLGPVRLLAHTQE